MGGPALSAFAAGVAVVDVLVLLVEVVVGFADLRVGVEVLVFSALNVVVCVSLLRRTTSRWLVVVGVAGGLVDVALGVGEIAAQLQLRYPDPGAAALWVSFSVVNAAVCALGVSRFSRTAAGGGG